MKYILFAIVSLLLNHKHYQKTLNDSSIMFEILYFAFQRGFIISYMIVCCLVASFIHIFTKSHLQTLRLKIRIKIKKVVFDILYNTKRGIV